MQASLCQRVPGRCPLLKGSGSAFSAQRRYPSRPRDANNATGCSPRRVPNLGIQHLTSIRATADAAERITFHGHPMVRSLHGTTIEITTDEHLTERGDCIVGVGAAKGCGQLGETLKTALRSDEAKVAVRLMVDGESFELTAEGDKGLELSHPHDLVIRTSRFTSDRTLAVGASAAARDIPRSIVSRLRSPQTIGVMEIRVLGI